MSVDRPGWFVPTLEALLARQDLSEAQTRTMMEGLIAGACGPAETAALLVAHRMKGETAEEVAAAARVLRGHMIRLETGQPDVLDTCGTGGDGSGTFNISTATAIVAAACDVPVVKHGNRAISGRTGSADVMQELGVRLPADAAQARRCLERVGLTFCLAPAFHPALTQVGPVRQRLGVRTLFNCLGPLANPAGAPYQLLGVGRPAWLDLLAGALARLGVKRALLVCGRDGLDEVSLTAPTQVREVRGEAITVFEWTPADFDLEPCAPGELQATTASDSATVIRAVLEGRPGGAFRVVLANVAAALLAAERVVSLTDGVRRAREAILSGAARDVLARLVACSQEQG